MIDVRGLNWRFLVPDEPEAFLFLPLHDEVLPGAISPNGNGGLNAAFERGPYPAVVVPDLTAWRENAAGSPARLLRELADAVGPGGWLYVGFSNRLNPARPMAGGSLRLRTAVRILRRRGFTEIQTFLPFPDHRCPAYVISAETRAPLGHFLARLVFPYSADRHDPQREQQRITWMRNLALASPHGIRVRFAPAMALVARRPR
jgi:hypothetical protein